MAAMGSQPQPHQGYPAPPPGYPGYSNEYPPQPAGYNNYPAAAAPHYDSPKPHGSRRRRIGCIIASLIACACTVITIIIVTIILTVVLRPKQSTYTVNSLSVVNFNTTPALSGDWDAVITAENPNDNLKGQFSNLKVEVINKLATIAEGNAPYFELDKHEKKQLNVKVTSSGVNLGLPQRLILDAIARERATGAVTFSLKITSRGRYPAPLFVRKRGMVAICNGLKVVFQNNTGTGSWDNGGKPLSCQFYGL